MFAALHQSFKQYPEFDYVLINADEIRGIKVDMQLEKDLDQTFHLLILEDPDTGYKYEGRIIQEREDDNEVDTVTVIKEFIESYKRKQLKQFLKSETIIQNPKSKIK